MIGILLSYVGTDRYEAVGWLDGHYYVRIDGRIRYVPHPLLDLFQIERPTE